MGSSSMEILEFVATLDLKYNERVFMKTWTKTEEAIKKSFSKSMAQAGEALVPIRKLKKMKRFQEKMLSEIALSQTKIEKLKEAGNAKQLAVERAKMAGMKKRHREELGHLDRVTKKRMSALQDAQRFMQKGMGEVAESFGSSLAGVMSNISSGNLGGLAGSVKGAGKGMSAAGAGLSNSKAGNVKGIGMLVKGMGSLMSIMGPALLAIGGIAAGLTALFGAAAAIDGKIKDLNKTFLENSSAAVDMGVGVGNLKGAVDDVRKAFTLDTKLGSLWGTTAKDHLEILAAYQNAGLTFKELRQGTEDNVKAMQNYKAATQAALTYSKLLGMSSSEIAKNMADYMEELGMSLLSVQKRFSAITSAARDSGFGTKRFFGMVLQATAGMSMYNVRLEETADLLLALGSALGQKKAAEMVRDLTKGDKDKSAQELYKDTMKRGVGVTNKRMMKDATAAAGDFMRDMADMPQKTTDIISQAFRRVGIDIGADKEGDYDTKSFTKKMARLSPAEISLLKSEVSRGSSSAAKRLTSLAGKSKSTLGTVGGAAAASQFGGAATILINKLDGIGKILKKPLHKMSLENMKGRIEREGVTGVKGEEYLKQYMVGQKYFGDAQMLSNRRAEIMAVKNLEQREKLAASYAESDAKATGSFITATGDIVKAVRDPEGNLKAGQKLGKGGKVTWKELIRASGSDLSRSASQDALTKDQILAQEIAKNTTDLNKMVKSGVEYWLEKIHGFVSQIWGYFSSPSETEKKNKREMLDKWQGKAKEARSAESKIQEEITALGIEMKTASPEARAQMGMKMEAKQRSLKDIQNQSLIAEEMQKKIHSKEAKGSKKEFEAAVLSSMKSKIVEIIGKEEMNRITTQSLKGRRTALSGDLGNEALKQATVGAAAAQDAAIYGKVGLQAPASVRGKDTSFWSSADVLGLADEGGARAGAPTKGSEWRRVAENFAGNVMPESLVPASLKDGKRGGKKISSEEFGKQQEKAHFKSLQKDRKDRKTDDKKLNSNLIQKIPEQIMRNDQKLQLMGILGQLPGLSGAGHKQKRERETEITNIMKTGRLGEKTRKGFGALSAEEQAALMSGPMGGHKGLFKSAMSTPAAKDMLVQIGADGPKWAHRVDQNDVGIIAKPGGALSKGGGGTQVVHVHQYNDARANWQTMKKLMG